MLPVLFANAIYTNLMSKNAYHELWIIYGSMASTVSSVLALRHPLIYIGVILFVRLSGKTALPSQMNNFRLDCHRGYG